MDENEVGLDNIVIGKEYRLVIWPNAEYRCLQCDRVLGWRTLDDPKRAFTIVTVVRSYEGFPMHCGSYAYNEGCFVQYPAPEGTFQINWQDGWTMIVPYTWLRPVDEEPRYPPTLED